MMGKPRWQAAYQPLGSLVLGLGKVDVVEDYRRELNLDSAVARVSYRAAGARFEREVIGSHSRRLSSRPRLRPWRAKAAIRSYLVERTRRVPLDPEHFDFMHA
jgi:hypothetical protein